MITLIELSAQVVQRESDEWVTCPSCINDGDLMCIYCNANWFSMNTMNITRVRWPRGSASRPGLVTAAKAVAYALWKEGVSHGIADYVDVTIARELVETDAEFRRRAFEAIE